MLRLIASSILVLGSVAATAEVKMVTIDCQTTAEGQAERSFLYADEDDISFTTELVQVIGKAPSYTMVMEDIEGCYTGEYRSCHPGFECLNIRRRTNAVRLEPSSSTVYRSCLPTSSITIHEDTQRWFRQIRAQYFAISTRERFVAHSGCYVEGGE